MSTRLPQNAVTAQAAILALLGHGESYGLHLMEQIKAASGGKVKLTPGHIYPGLHALKANGLVTTWVGEGRLEGGRPRRYYSLTVKGQRALRETRSVVRGLFGS